MSIPLWILCFSISNVSSLVDGGAAVSEPTRVMHPGDFQFFHYNKHFIYASLVEPSASSSRDRGGVLGEGPDSPGSLVRTWEKGTVPAAWRERRGPGEQGAARGPPACASGAESAGAQLSHTTRRSRPQDTPPRAARCSELPHQLPGPEVRAGIAGKPVGACARTGVGTLTVPSAACQRWLANEQGEFPRLANLRNPRLWRSLIFAFWVALILNQVLGSSRSFLENGI